MARNPFEQLQDVVVEPRQAFEDSVGLILKCLFPDARRVRVFRGDGGVDVFTGTLGDGGKADVYQAKYFTTVWGDPQKQQIRDSYDTARRSKDYQLNRWILCVPTRLTKEDLRWFDEWRDKQDRKIELIDGDDLTGHLASGIGAGARSKLRAWGVIGIQAGGPALNAAVVVRPANESSGLTAVLILKVENSGDLSARNIKATIRHTETGCVLYREQPDWENLAKDGSLNPRTLRFCESLNPGDHSIIMGIPLCERSEMPFTIRLKLTADDCSPATLSCQLTAQQVVTVGTFAFRIEPIVSVEIATSESKAQFFPPSLPLAKEMLQLILEHPIDGERGLTEIIGDSPISSLECLFIPNTTEAGAALSIKKSPFRNALKELCQLGWLLPSEGDGRTRVYELNPEAGRVSNAAGV
jgi:hypothetical protein